MSFQPIWGILSWFPFSAMPEGNLTTVPFMMPSPLTGPSSSLSSNRSCNPRHIPRNGFPDSTDLIISSVRPYLSRFLMHSLNAPTPGRTSEPASFNIFLSRVTVALAPIFFKSLPDAYTHVFNRVVKVNIQVPLRLYRQIEKPVLRKKSEHVVEKRDACL